MEILAAIVEGKADLADLLFFVAFIVFVVLAVMDVMAKNIKGTLLAAGLALIALAWFVL